LIKKEVRVARKENEGERKVKVVKEQETASQIVVEAV